MERKSTKEQIQMLDLYETIYQMARANCARWYGHVLRKDKNDFLRRALDIKVKGTMKGGRPWNTWQLWNRA